MPQPVVFVVRMPLTKPDKIIGSKSIKCWTCIYGAAIEFKGSKYEELGEEVDDVGNEWKKYVDTCVGMT